MLKLIKTNTVFLTRVMITATLALNACGEKTVIPNTTVYSFKHKVPESFRTSVDLSSDELKPFMDEDIFFLGVALRNVYNSSDVEFDIGVQFNTNNEGRRIFVEKMVLDTPDLETERVINELVDIDVLNKGDTIYFKRFMPFEKISGDSIPLTANFFTLRIDYKLEDKPSKQMSIRFDNTTFLGPVL